MVFRAERQERMTRLMSASALWVHLRADQRRAARVVDVQSVQQIMRCQWKASTQLSSIVTAC